MRGEGIGERGDGYMFIVNRRDGVRRVEVKIRVERSVLDMKDFGLLRKEKIR